jgi:hypothetical protein
MNLKQFFQIDFAFVEMHFSNFANGFSIYGNAFIFKKNAKIKFWKLIFTKVKIKVKMYFQKLWNLYRVDIVSY